MVKLQFSALCLAHSPFRIPLLRLINSPTPTPVASFHSREWYRFLQVWLFAPSPFRP
jgi:hypothetical protein